MSDLGRTAALAQSLLAVAIDESICLIAHGSQAAKDLVVNGGLHPLGSGQNPQVFP